MVFNLSSRDSSPCSSPRLSFSHDLPQTNSNQTQEDIDATRLDMSLLSDQNYDFNFCVTAAFTEKDNSPADELFFNGVIIPIQMKEKLDSIAGCINQEEEEITSTTTATVLRQEKTASKPSFWRFKRSSSLNIENYNHKKSSSFWSIPLLSRSKSTGSSSNDNPKYIQKNSCSVNGKLLNNNQCPRSSLSSYQKPPLRKSGSGGGGSHVNGMRNGAAMNVPPPYITKGTSDLLGFGSIFRNGSREKKSKK